MHSIKSYEPANGSYVYSGVFKSFNEGMEHKYDTADTVVPIDDETARKLILSDIYEDIIIEYSEKGLEECDENEELQADMFDNEVNRYIATKRPGWETLIDYDHDKDNYFVE